MPHEVSQSAKSMSNNRATEDQVSVELLKYAPISVHQEIAQVMKRIFETHDVSEVEIINTCELTPCPKPKKPKGPVTNLRPINLLTTIRKILSNITLRRINSKVDQFVSHRQAAYRSGRSTTDIIWAYKWIIAKTKVAKIRVYITGIDMSSAFDTIEREKLLNILDTFLDEDESRIIRVLLSKTTIRIRTPEGVQSNPFVSNIGSPQGDGISGTLFNIYFENALRKIRTELSSTYVDIEHSYSSQPCDYHLPDEMEYADDADFLTEHESRKTLLTNTVTETLETENLHVKESKTENTVIERQASRNVELWRHVKKLGSLLGDDPEDIANRKILAIIAMKDVNKIWVRNKKVQEKRRIKLYKSIVKSVMLYNSSTWALRKSDEKALDSFHQQQLRRVLNIKYPHRISCSKLYKRCNELSLSLEILKSRWRMLGHCLRLHHDTPARKAMLYYFDTNGLKKFVGGPRETIVRTLNRDIKLTKIFFPEFPLKELKTRSNLLTAQSVALDRESWKELTDIVFSVAQAENPYKVSTR